MMEHIRVWNNFHNVYLNTRVKKATLESIKGVIRRNVCAQKDCCCETNVVLLNKEGYPIAIWERIVGRWDYK